MKKNNYAIIYNGVPLQNISEIGEVQNKEHLNFIKNKFVVGTSCRFNAFKRVDRLIDAFADFSKTKSDTVLMLVGDGVMRKKLEERVIEKGIESKTLFTGYQANVHSYQKLMDITVFPSENEPFGLVAVETLTLGKPTLVFKDGGGILEIIIDAFPEDVVDNIADLVGKLNHYYNKRFEIDSELIQKRKTIASRYNISTMEIEFLKEYKRVTDEKD